MHHRTTQTPTPPPRAAAAPSVSPIHRSSFIVHRSAFHHSSFIVHRSAFTLVELMVSVAMVVLLLFGIHQVFRMSSNTIGTGQAVNAITREIRAAQTVMQEDFRRSLKESPLFVISSQPVGVVVDPSTGTSITPRLAPNPFHFTSRAERDRDLDRNAATIDRDGDGNEETSYGPAHLAQVNDRIHRSDIFGFCARGLFSRQTADDGLFVSPTKSYDAWIWYGHTRLPDRLIPGYFDPGVIPGTPPNTESENQFASNWVLGRRAVLMKDPDTILSGTLNPRESFIGVPVTNVGTTPIRVPLRYDSLPPSGIKTASVAGRRPPTLIQSRLDIVGVTSEQFRLDVIRMRQALGFGANWWTNTWWTPLVFRYECDPHVKKPINSENMARTTPHFVGGASHFIVEFAGDFLTQDNNPTNPTTGNPNPNYGLVTGAGPDGVIDFIMLYPALERQADAGYTQEPQLRVRRTRWYGLPRDSNGDGLITGCQEQGARANAMPDVVPVYDVLVSNTSLNREPRPAFEVAWPGDPRNDHQKANGYGTIKNPQSFRYVCAWTDSAPAMIRIVMKLEDPAGRLADGQWTEFVLDAP